MERGSRQRPIGSQRGGVGGGNTPWVAIGVGEQFLGVGLENYHRAVQLVDLGEQDVVDAIQGLDPALTGDLANAAARQIGQARVIEKHDAIPVADRADQAAELLEPRPRRRVGEGARQLRLLHHQNLGRQDNLQIRGTKQPRVHVEGYRLAARRRLVHQVEGTRQVVVAAARRDVGDLQARTRRLGAANRLGDRLHRRFVAVARVGRVEAAVAGGVTAQRRDLFLRGADLRAVLEPGREAPTAFRQRFVEEGAHPVAFVGRRRPVFGPDDGQTQLSVGHQYGHVDGRPRRLEAGVIAGHALPVER